MSGNPRVSMETIARAGLYSLVKEMIPCGHGCGTCPHGPYFVLWFNRRPIRYLGRDFNRAMRAWSMLS